jgi:hypothetical protein
MKIATWPSPEARMLDNNIAIARAPRQDHRATWSPGSFLLPWRKRDMPSCLSRAGGRGGRISPEQLKEPQRNFFLHSPREDGAGANCNRASDTPWLWHRHPDKCICHSNTRNFDLKQGSGKLQATRRTDPMKQIHQNMLQNLQLRTPWVVNLRNISSHTLEQ